jgi:hypothetical protein
MDPSKSAHVDKIELIRDRLHMVLSDGTLQFAQPANGVVFGAVFRGTGSLTVIPPNPIEAQQLRLFIKQDRLTANFTEATFSFTDSTFDEVSKRLQWAASSASGDDLYAKRQEHRENLGAALLPRVFKSLLSAERAQAPVFFADLKTDHGWVELHFDAGEPEQVQVGRWVDVGPFQNFDTWLSFPAGDVASTVAFQDSAAKADFLVPNYHIDAAVTGGAELSATTRAEIHPRVAGERVLLFTLDSNLRLESVKDAQGHPLTFFQSREGKDRNQSYGEYVAVALPKPTQTGESILLDFRYGGKRAVRRVGDGNYFCESFGWYPVLLSKRTGVETWRPLPIAPILRSTFAAPKNTAWWLLVAKSAKPGTGTCWSPVGKATSP